MTGGCLCGEVRLEIQGSPVRSGICHCLDCRKHHGALFRSFAIFPGESLFVTGEPTHFESKPGVRRHFCARCGSPLFVRYAGTDHVEVFLGALDEPNQIAPEYELWCIRREAWLPVFPTQHQYERDRPK